MTELTKELRNQLSKIIVSARREAEVGAHAALESLAVGRHEPFSEMTPEQRQLRNRLRAHGRQLGDKRDKGSGQQSIARLSHEVAYAHWHRMLFARFLAENHLLIHPDAGVSVSLEDIRELAQEAGENPDAMAARFAQQNLPQIFRGDDPVLEVPLAPNVNQKLVRSLTSLPAEIFVASDSLGWTYQYWQTEKKDEVNAAGDKISAEELPAVTQLFTEHYMVRFLYDNTIGAWYAGKVLAQNPELALKATCEDELREACALKTKAGDTNWEYLRFVRDPCEPDKEGNPVGSWRPAAGTFEKWPKFAKDLKVLDPCCGSGHFLVVGLTLLVSLRMLEENLELEQAICAVLGDNLFGVELDQRCTQIAAFNVATAAWKLARKPIELPTLNIACSGLSIGSSKRDWLNLGGDDELLKAGMERLYGLFRRAPELGSLIDPKTIGNDLFEASFEQLRPLLKRILKKQSGNFDITERAIAAQGMAGAAEFLAGKYTLVITNVPFLNQGAFSKSLREFCEQNHAVSKPDLATVFIDRSLNLVQEDGSVAVVSPRIWMSYAAYFEGFRRKLLREKKINFVSELGPRAFQTISGEVVNVGLFSFSNSKPNSSELIAFSDVSSLPNPELKASSLKYEELLLSNQRDQENNPAAVISAKLRQGSKLLAEFADIYEGISRGDTEAFDRFFWELPRVDGDRWRFLVSSWDGSTNYGGRGSVFLWESGRGNLVNHPSARVQGQPAWNREAVFISRTRLTAGLTLGQVHAQNGAAIVPRNPSDLAAVLMFCKSQEYRDAVSALNQKLIKPTGVLAAVPFDREKWCARAQDDLTIGRSIECENTPCEQYFHGHPERCVSESVLQVAVSRLLGYRWPLELGSDLDLTEDCCALLAKCDDLADFVDEDGIVCLSATRGEPSAEERVREFLVAAYGDDWSAIKEKEILAAAAGGKKPAGSLRIWLRDRFFEDHCRLFQNRPFIWHIWDGHKEGFHCFVNAHRLTGSSGEGRKTLESIAYSYLKDWIDRQREDQQGEVQGAEAKLAHALDLQIQLEKILEGEPPYDLFVRWKPLYEQAIGWEPDFNDGIRLNIRPFMKAKLRNGGKEGAGILRIKPNIKWVKDRGKEPKNLRPKKEFPWFWGANGESNEPLIARSDHTAEIAEHSDFDGNRWNDMHYSRAVKGSASETYKKRELDA